ncbi:unnamed protein product (macronuclear) [Paramecium tetraurelia]|uniref:Uncharacterized protein n=1 Tax=Paramecium tetraurelia TaxID=5888 RepID=A0EA75_PARTE|nr:uncharacterized protein GSPATT00024924001 [Paramecium tetraurelia]CAK92192.1 unnamed protein product [Paramecium tetraurelia]|eukprot:XP_001459589.1 hypothetical protein (macronuclear) [Paramecium tetraurelia strain d4-2]
MISITSILTDVSYKIFVYFKSSIFNPVLKATLRHENIVNVQDNTLLSKEEKLRLSSPNKMSNEHKALLLKTALLTRIFIGIAFLAGNLEILWNLLNMLQQLSQLKFHNLQFPVNLFVYFEIFTISSLAPIIDGLQTDVSFEDLFDFKFPIIQAKWKFEYYEINCHFF